ncbi:MAG: GHKL domain-containing protein [Eubacteriales bacterium]|nr:GHKL domain-containing protein [Eubacteriales bacterium]
MYTKKNWYTLLLSVLPIVSVWIILTLMYVGQQIILSKTINTLITFSCILLLFVNLLIFGLYDYIQKKAAQQTQLQLELQKEADLVSYYKLLVEQDEQQKIFLHDIKKHLMAIGDLNKNSSRQMVSQYIEQLTESPELSTSAKFCDNDTLNAILSRYISHSVEKDIRFSTDIRAHSVDFLPFGDMTALFCNLLDNAMESAEKMENSYIELNIFPKKQNNCVVLTLINSCRISPFSENQELKTTKTDMMHHGFGVKSIERIVEKHNGIMQMYFDNNSKTFHTIISFQGQR